MTNSTSDVRPGKRQRLIESAQTLFHEQGVHPTTLAEVANRADVPVGNVYYYFKTKDELVKAVVDGYTEEATRLIDSFARHRTAQERLKALVRSWDHQREAVARHGCPIGTLCTELDKAEGSSDSTCATVLSVIIDWAEAQFRELGRRDARDLAIALFAGIQGAALLASTFREPQILTRQTRHLERWIDSL